MSASQRGGGTRKIVLIGGYGFLGSNVAAALVAGGDAVDVVDDLSAPLHLGSDQARWPVEGVRHHRFDPAQDPDRLIKLADGADAVVHLAALTGTGESLYKAARYTQANAGLSALLADLLVERLDVGSLVFLSTRAVYGDGYGVCPACGEVALAPRRGADLSAGQWSPRCSNCGQLATPRPMRVDDPARPTTPYGLSKSYGESVLGMAARSSRSSVSVLRPFNLYGELQDPTNPYAGVVAAFLGAAATGSPIHLYEDGEIVRDLLHVSDLVSAVSAVLETPPPPGEPQVVNVGSGQATTLTELAQECVEVARALGLGGASIATTGLARLGDPRHTVAELSGNPLIGWQPRTTLRAGLERTLEWILAAGVVVPGRGHLEWAENELAQRSLLLGPGQETRRSAPGPDSTET